MEGLFDEKAVQGLDYLLHHFWVLRKENPAMYQLIRERQKVLKRYANDKLGLHLHIRQHFIKLEKIPIVPERWMGIQTFQTPMDYMIFCYALAFIEGKSIEEQFLLSELCENIRAIGYEQIELDWTVYQHRKALIRVMKILVDLHLIATIDGDVQGFDHHENQEVLYEVTIYSRYFMRAFPEEFTQYEHVQQLIEGDRNMLGEDERRKRVYRQLFTSPAIYRQDGQDQDFLYIRNFRNRINDDIERHSDFKLHVFKNVAFLSVTEPKKYYDLFPNTRAITDILLQLSHYLHTHLASYPPRENGDIVLTEGQLQAVLEEIREQLGEGWAKLYRDKTTAAVREEVVEELMNWRMATLDDGFVHIHALLGVLAGTYPPDYQKEAEK
ncbi:TIGR02678 family protein [Lysinibacillus macroides]|uniref:Cytosolic protein n=1 Tax=Lysinibacillus macroides TaxID=33935 RepID=A0A0N0CVE6_9BACI|nr:TIGR02678 family protein [Lysinibacillus macroides]KOY81631.1 cytosolic protein [Lysinibacillus macroides]QPR69522.1 TIGR02678 family protein [Lysinibacillus macroides]